MCYLMLSDYMWLLYFLLVNNFVNHLMNQILAAILLTPLPPVEFVLHVDSYRLEHELKN